MVTKSKRQTVKPPFSREEFEQLKASLRRGNQYIALTGWSPDYDMLVEIRPHVMPGYCHVTVASNGIAEGTTRGVKIQCINRALRCVCCNQEQMSWWASPCVPVTANPWLSSPPGRGRESYPGDVYFLRAEQGGPIKIGWSVEPESRMKSFQCGSPVPLRLVAIVRDGGRTTEAALHRQFQASWLYGEWFEATEELLTWIRSNAEEV